MNYFILAAGRSASTLLVNSLSCHPTVSCHHEPFNQHGWHRDLVKYTSPLDALNQLSSYGLTPSFYEKLSSLIQNKVGMHRGKTLADPFKNTQNLKAEGFKITWAQADPMLSDLQKWLNTNSVKCIYLYRHDSLARYVSYQLAQANGLWNSSYRTHKDISLRVSTIAFRQFCDRELALEKRLLNTLKSTQTKFISLSYEELNKNPLNTVNSALTFLNSQPLQSLEVATKKLVVAPLHDLVTNFADLDSESVNKNMHKKRLEWLDISQN